MGARLLGALLLASLSSGFGTYPRCCTRNLAISKVHVLCMVVHTRHVGPRSAACQASKSQILMVLKGHTSVITSVADTSIIQYGIILAESLLFRGPQQ
jgi:hypothetical protein